MRQSLLRSTRHFSSQSPLRSHDNPLGLPQAPTHKRPPPPSSHDVKTFLPRAQRGLPPRRSIPNVKHVIAVSSAKGGVGKSTISTNLAIAFARHGLRSGILDTDIFGPSIPTLLGLRDQKAEVDEKGKLVPLTAFGVRSMSMGFLGEGPVAWRGLMVMKALQQLVWETEWTAAGGGGGLDVLTLDLPPGTGDTQLTLQQQVQLSGAVIVSTPQDVAMIDAVKGVDMMRKMDTRVLGLVQNMSLFACPKCGERSHVFGEEGVRRWSEREGVRLLGDVELRPQICVDGDRGVPTAVAESDDGTFMRMAREILGLIGKEGDAEG